MGGGGGVGTWGALGKLGECQGGVGKIREPWVTYPKP